MSKNEKSLSSLKALGVSAKNNKELYKYDKPDVSLLERFPNPRKNHPLVIHIECPEFTSLCPLTGQPDFANIKIVYTPDEWCVESKSLKLYLTGYRNHGAFHEKCVSDICDHLTALLNPHHIAVKGEFTPRGGIPFHPTATYTRKPEEVRGKKNAS